MSEHAPSAAKTKDPERGAVVSTIVGDRLCVKCGFNLTGQPVVREVHYNMLLARCPECGAAAALQEYPLLGRWANRWAASLAALWLLFLLIWVIGLGFATWGIAVGSANFGADRFDEFITDAHEAWRDEQGLNQVTPAQTKAGVAASVPAGPAAAAPAPQASQPQQAQAQQAQPQAPQSQPQPPQPMLTPMQPGMSMRVIYGAREIDRAWWRAADKRAILASAGGFRRAVAPDAFIPLLPLTLLCFVFGCAGSVAMLHLRGARLALVALGPIVIASALTAVMIAVAFANHATSAHLDSRDAAWDVVGPRLMILAVVFAGVSLALGLLTGRPLVRRCARALLPPRLCNSLSLLWLTDNRPLPKPRRRPE